MGANLARNFERNGYQVAVYNRTKSVTDEFINEFDGRFVPRSDLAELASALKAPRKLIIMVKAGPAVDAVIDELLKVLEPGDLIMDGGNSHYHDTKRREAVCREKGIKFLGVGISGGEEGALMGPSIMPGGEQTGWSLVSEMLEKVAAQVEGKPCVSYLGPEGAGHFVKMVHNGIEYADMQLIAESYALLNRVGGLGPSDLAPVFEDWNKGVLSSFLIEITAKIFERKDELGEGFLVDQVLDQAAQKGTGRWTVESALELGTAVPSISAAVDARTLSSQKPKRIKLAEEFSNKGTKSDLGLTAKELIKVVHDGLYAAKIIAYAQGMELIDDASREWSWNLNLSEIVALWRGGCIIRAQFLKELSAAYATYKTTPPSLLSIPIMKRALEESHESLRQCIKLGLSAGVATPAFSSAIAYFDSYTTADLPQNLTQAQRDFFGAHTYKRKDREGVFHSNWEE